METRGIMKAFPKVKRHRSREGKDAPPVKKAPDQSITGNVIYYRTQIYAAIVEILHSSVISLFWFRASSGKSG